MLDIKFIRENKQIVVDAVRKKHSKADIDALLLLDDRRLDVLKKVEELRGQQNTLSKEIMTASDPAAKQKIIDGGKVIKESLSLKEEELKELIKEWQLLMLAVPNVPDISVPEGEDDSDNKEIRTWGEKPQFSFTPKNQIDLLVNHNLVDFERGTKVAGFRGYILKNDAALLEMALWQFGMAQLVKKGFEPLLVPSLVRPDSFFGTGYLPQGEEDLYKTQDGDYLSGTAEVAAMGYLMGETLEAEMVPRKWVAFSPCFRREAGSHGKDTRGLIRLHEFYKVEQVVLSEASHETSVALHEELLKNAEEIMQALNIPYRVVINCAGDLGQGQVKKYDIEAWVPSESAYRETHSISYFHDFQTRRLNIRYRDAEGVTRFAHSLNGTALATPRLLVPLIENYQQADGTILVPEVLRPYLGKDVIG